jgi:hypothetical protein
MQTIISSHIPPVNKEKWGKRMEKFKKISVAMLLVVALLSLTLAYAVLYYSHTFPNTITVETCGNLRVTWVSNGQNVSSYDWGTVKSEQIVYTPEMEIKNVGNVKVYIGFTSNVPDGFTLKLVYGVIEVNAGDYGGLPELNLQNSIIVKFKLVPISVISGSYTFNISINGASTNNG